MCKLFKVLCQMDGLMFEFGVTKKPDRDRSVMKDNLRKSATRRYKIERDCAVINEFINIMQYIILAMQEFEKHTPIFQSE